MQRIRLLNVGQVLHRIGGEHDLRANCVEISADDCRAVVLMLHILTKPDQVIDDDVDVVMVGRLVIPGRTLVAEPAEPTNGPWLLRTLAGDIYVRPFAGEAIWSDPSFGAGELPDDQQRLYASLRATNSSIVAHERWLRSTPESSQDLRDVHVNTIKALKRQVRLLESRIAVRSSSARQERTTDA